MNQLITDWLALDTFVNTSQITIDLIHCRNSSCLNTYCWTESLDWVASLWSRGGHAWTFSGYGHVKCFDPPSSPLPPIQLALLVSVSKIKLRGKSFRSWCDGSLDWSFMVDPLSYLLFWSKMYLCGKSVHSWCDGSSDQSFMVDLLSYFLFQPVFHDWCNKGCGMCYPVRWYT